MSHLDITAVFDDGRRIFLDVAQSASPIHIEADGSMADCQ
jgi:hypothetical protein